MATTIELSLSKLLVESIGDDMTDAERDLLEESADQLIWQNRVVLQALAIQLKAQAAPKPKRRGRPRKAAQPVASGEAQANPTPARRRGRPRKVAEPAPAPVAVEPIEQIA